jgi:hypothetical protein
MVASSSCLLSLTWHATTRLARHHVQRRARAIEKLRGATFCATGGAIMARLFDCFPGRGKKERAALAPPPWPLHDHYFAVFEVTPAG